MAQLRLCRTEDFDAVLALLSQLWTGESLNHDTLRVAYYRALNSDAHVFLGATEGLHLVGFGSLSIRNSLWQAGILGHVDELVVDREYRGRGIGTRLLAELAARARQLGCGRIELDSAFHREDAHRFYARNGFEKRAYLFSKSLDRSCCD